MSRGNGRQQKFDETAAAIRAKHGLNALRQAKEIAPTTLHISTGFSTLDFLTGCGGIPLGAMTLLSGMFTSGKETIAYKTIASAQAAYPKQYVALVTLHGDSDADYLKRAGVVLDRLFLYEPPVAPNVVDALVDMAKRRNVRLIVVNALADLQADQATFRYLTRTLNRLNQTLQATRTGLIWLDNPSAPWIRFLNWDESRAVRQYAALSIEVQLEQMIVDEFGEMVGYASHAKLHKSRWTKSGRMAPVAIEFNGTIKARDTWS